MSREKNLIINTIFYFSGSLGKGIATILIVFIGSHFIEPSSMGTYDVVISTISLIQPIIIFQINDGMYRWLLDKDCNKASVIKSCFKLAIVNMLVINIGYLILVPLLSFSHKFLVLILLNANCIYPMFQQLTRGLKNHKCFALSGIYNAAIVLLLCIIFVCLLKTGISGLYLSQIAAAFVSIGYMFLCQKEFFLSALGSKTDKPMLMDIIKYSVMLIPNTINQWVIKALDKYTILFFLSSFSNGIYTIAHKFMEMLLMMNNMFYSAWVEQSIVEYESIDRDKYYTKIFDIYSGFLFSIIFIAIPATKYIIYIIIGPEYYEAWKYVPIMYLSVVFSAFASFYGTGYLSVRKTKGIFKTSFISALINTGINIIFISHFGLQTVTISSCIAYFVMWIYRVIETKKFFSLKINIRKMIFFIVTAIIYIICVLKDILLLDVILLITAIILSVAINFKYLKNIFKSFLMRGKNV